jgi:hypothetical protein
MACYDIRVHWRHVKGHCFSLGNAKHSLGTTAPNVPRGRGNDHLLCEGKRFIVAALWTFPNTVKARYDDFRYNDNRDIAIASGAHTLVPAWMTHSI